MALQLIVSVGVVDLAIRCPQFRSIVVIHFEGLREEINRHAQVDEPQQIPLHGQRSHHAGSVLTSKQHNVCDWREVEADVEAVSHDCLIVDNEQDEHHHVNHGDGKSDESPQEDEHVEVAHGALLNTWWNRVC
jgi:hypothetical protein